VSVSRGWREEDEEDRRVEAYVKQKNQDRQHMYNATLRRVRVTTAIVERQQVLNIMNAYVCMYSCLSYRARNAHALCYMVICVLSSTTIFFHIIS
jgi:hypothetical protein